VYSSNELSWSTGGCEESLLTSPRRLHRSPNVSATARDSRHRVACRLSDCRSTCERIHKQDRRWGRKLPFRAARSTVASIVRASGDWPRATYQSGDWWSPSAGAHQSGALRGPGAFAIYWSRRRPTSAERSQTRLVQLPGSACPRTCRDLGLCPDLPSAFLSHEQLRTELVHEGTIA